MQKRDDESMVSYLQPENVKLKEYVRTRVVILGHAYLRNFLVDMDTALLLVQNILWTVALVRMFKNLNFLAIL